jgi:predicted phosphodiesterase
MRYALVSDIHSNIEAFDAVLMDIKGVGVDRILFLGDIIGYGPNPNECIERLLEVADISLGGNHDWAVIGKTPDDYFNPYAKEAVEWTRKQLKDQHKDFLLRTKAADVVDGFQIAHSSPMNPEEWRYILSYHDASENYPFLDANLCFIGHSHQPVVIEFNTQDDVEASRVEFKELDKDRKAIVNIGSVGQPRDSNIKSCWVLFDSDLYSVEYRRVSYDVEAVQKKMEAIGLPRYLIDRLGLGR